MSAFSWLRPGHDRQLAADRYPHRQSATQRVAGKAHRQTGLRLLDHDTQQRQNGGQ